MTQQDFTLNVLSIDATTPEMTGVVMGLSGSDIEVKKSVTINADEWWKECFQHSLPQPEGEEIEGEPTELEKISFPLDQITAQLRDYPWDEAVIILPPIQALGLHLELPFSMKKSLQRIAPLETQDKIPFDLDPFLCQATPIRKLTDDIFDIHIDLYPKKLVESVLKACKGSGVDPAVVTIPAALGQLCHALYPKYISANSVIVFSSPLGYSCSILFEGSPVSHFHLHGDPNSQNGSRPQSPYLEQSLNVAVAHAEQRFDSQIEKIYFVGSEDKFSFWNPARLSKPCELIGFEDLLPKCAPHAGVSTLAATSLMENREQHLLLPNYRSGEYAYRPQLRNLRDGSRILLKPFLLVALCFLFMLPVLYQIREFRISKLEREAHEAVQTALPHRLITPGEELATLSNELASANALLSKLATGDGTEPQKELALIFEEMVNSNSAGDITLRNLRIAPERTIIEGTVSSYQDAELLENIYKKQNSRYCNVELDTKGVGGKGGTQNFELTLVKRCD